MTEPPLIPPHDTQPIAYAATVASDADIEHLRLLAIFHWVVGPITILMACLPIVHLVMGILMVTGQFPVSPQQRNPPDIRWVGWFFIAFALVFILIGWTLGGLTLYSGFQMRRRQRRVFSIVVAGVNCLFFPFGTILGIFTLIVLLRRSVEALYRSTART